MEGAVDDEAVVKPGRLCDLGSSTIQAQKRKEEKERDWKLREVADMDRGIRAGGWVWLFALCSCTLSHSFSRSNPGM